MKDLLKSVKRNKANITVLLLLALTYFAMLNPYGIIVAITSTMIVSSAVVQFMFQNDETEAHAKHHFDDFRKATEYILRGVPESRLVGNIAYFGLYYGLGNIVTIIWILNILGYTDPILSVECSFIQIIPVGILSIGLSVLTVIDLRKGLKVKED